MCKCNDGMGYCGMGCPLPEPKRQPHKHAVFIKAWADGALIECKQDNGDWYKICSPLWDATEYRIKPEPKPDIVVNTLMEFKESWRSPSIRRVWNGLRPGGYQYDVGRYPQVRYTFDGETNELKSVEIIK